MTDKNSGVEKKVYRTFIIESDIVKDNLIIHSNYFQPVDGDNVYRNWRKGKNKEIYIPFARCFQKEKLADIVKQIRDKRLNIKALFLTDHEDFDDDLTFNQKGGIIFYRSNNKKWKVSMRVIDVIESF